MGGVNLLAEKIRLEKFIFAFLLGKRDFFRPCCNLYRSHFFAEQNYI